MLTVSELRDFESGIAESFNRGEIPYPVHFSNGNEDQLIEIFKEIRAEDWVFGSWRLHYHALLKGVPPGELNDAILRGESMALRFPAYRVYGSAIVGGTIPIALGVALAIKRKGGNELVWCFLGDMTSEGGQFHECEKYAAWNYLPIRWVIEDNGISVLTPTAETWGGKTDWTKEDVIHYRYKSKWPHAGAGKRIQF
jgi:pyruvate dehydrogenase E1 component alpha subunit